MSLFYKVGFTQSEVSSGKEARMSDIEKDFLLQNIPLVFKEKGNVLIYDSFDNSGKYFHFYYIKDSLFPFYAEKIKLNVLETIDEKDLPENLGISFSL